MVQLTKIILKQAARHKVKRRKILKSLMFAVCIMLPRIYKEF